MKAKYINNLKPLSLAVTTALVAITGGTSTSLLAQERGIEEIVIQAERRDTTESTTAISMEVFTPDDLAKNQIVNFEDLQKVVPNIQFNTNGGGWAQANIRGVGNPSSGGPAEQVGVPIMIDGGSQGEEVGLGGSFFDLANIQVLRGPQGTFIGQSAAGGAILVTSARPNFDGINGNVEATVGNYNQKNVQGAINLPISDTFAARIAFLQGSRDSFYNNVASGQVASGRSIEPGNSKDEAFRIGLLWQPNDKLRGYFKIENTHFEYDGTPGQPNLRPFTGFNDDDGDPTTPSIPVTTYSQYAPGPNGELYAPRAPFDIAIPFDRFVEQDNIRYTIDLSYELDSGISLNSVTNYFDMSTGNTNLAGNSRAFASQVQVELGPEVYTINQEFTVVSPDDGDVDWLFGFAANKRHTEVAVAVDPFGGIACGWTFSGDWTACPTSGPVVSQLYIDSDTEIEQWGVFGQLDWQVNDEVELTLGGRYNDDYNYVEGTTFFAFPVGGPFPPPPADGVPCPGTPGAVGLTCPAIARNMDAPGATRSEYENNTPTYKIGVNWEPSDNHFFYAFYARGYKSGQPTSIDPVTGIPLPSATLITEEIIDDYEFGWKGTLFDGALYGELNYFQMDYTDMQMSGYRTSAINSSGGAVNIGDSEVSGVEGSFRTSVGILNISGSFGYTKSELGAITTYDNRAFNPLLPGGGQGVPIGDTSKGCVEGGAQLCFDFSPYVIGLAGQENPNSPKLSWNLSADFSFTTNSGATIVPSITFSHADDNYTSILQFPGENYFTRDERDLLNVSVTYGFDDWTFQLFANNATDETYLENAGATALYGDPRTVGLRAKMNF